MNKLYPLYWWFATLILSSIFFSIWHLATEGNATLDGVFLLILFGGFFSLPTLLVVYIVYIVLNRNDFSAVGVRWILNAVAIASIWVTFRLISGMMQEELSIVYTIGAVVSGFFFNVKDKTKNELG